MEQPSAIGRRPSLIECPGADSNRYAFRHHPLKMACLPISPPGQLFSAHRTAAICLKPPAIRCFNTGPTGLEPATSRVTVECSNQTELRPQLLESGSETPSHCAFTSDCLSVSPLQSNRGA